jgi:hypothetical protein
MPRLLWDRAESDLRNVDPAVVIRLKRSAEEVLHSIPPWVHSPSDEGICDGIMWHRAMLHVAPDEQEDGPQNYFLFYRSGSGEEFQILGIRSIYQVADVWASWMRRQPGSLYGEWDSA